MHFNTHPGALSQQPLCLETSNNMPACPSLLAFSPWQIKAKPKLQGKGGSITRQRRRLRFECLSRSSGRPGRPQDGTERAEAIRFLKATDDPNVCGCWQSRSCNFVPEARSLAGWVFPSSWGHRMSFAHLKDGCSGQESQPGHTCVCSLTGLSRA